MTPCLLGLQPLRELTDLQRCLLDRVLKQTGVDGQPASRNARRCKSKPFLQCLQSFWSGVMSSGTAPSPVPCAKPYIPLHLGTPLHATPITTRRTIMIPGSRTDQHVAFHSGSLASATLPAIFLSAGGEVSWLSGQASSVTGTTG